MNQDQTFTTEAGMKFVVPTTKRVALLSITVFLLSGCGTAPPEESVSGPPKPSPAQPPPSIVLQVGDPPQQQPGLHNVMRLTDRIYSGGEPEGEPALAALAALGVKTVVSVDGAKPDVASARRHGLRYVHIPIGYDGVDEPAGRSLARLVDEVPGPIYIHSHHRKHRGPAAAAVACVAAGSLTSRQAVEILERAGTSRGYAGLWRDVESYTRPPPDTALPPLVETAEVGSLAAAMSQLDRGFDRLKLCRDVNWTVPDDHPDIVPAQEALLVRETLHETARHLTSDHDDTFRAWLAESEELAKQLEAWLAAGDATAATAAFAQLEQSCNRCHARYRDQ